MIAGIKTSHFQSYLKIAIFRGPHKTTNNISIIFSFVRKNNAFSYFKTQNFPQVVSSAEQGMRFYIKQNRSVLINEK